MSQSVEKLIKYNNETNPRDRAMSILWVQVAAKYLIPRFAVKPRAKMLDYGCGYFDLGNLLETAGCAVDGFDINSEGFKFAKRWYPVKGELFSDITSIPPCSYDAVIANSVIQYFNGIAELDLFIQNCKRWLKGGGEVILSDVIPIDYFAPIDALWSLFYAGSKGSFWAMMRHLYRAAFKGDDVSLLKIDVNQLSELAAKNGFRIEKTEKNYTPSIFRYTVLLTKIN